MCKVNLIEMQIAGRMLCTVNMSGLPGLVRIF